VEEKVRLFLPKDLEVASGEKKKTSRKRTKHSPKKPSVKPLSKRDLIGNKRDTRWWRSEDLHFFFVIDREDHERLLISVKRLMAKGGTISGYYTGEGFGITGFRDFTLKFNNILLSYGMKTHKCMVRISNRSHVYYLKCLDPVFSLAGFEEYDVKERDLTLLNTHVVALKKMLVCKAFLPRRIAHELSYLMGKYTLEDIAGFVGEEHWRRLERRLLCG